MYKYILFDIDNTLVDFNKTLDAAVIETMRVGGYLNPTKEDLARFAQANDDIWFGMELDHSEREEICRWYHEGYAEYLRRATAALREMFDLKLSDEETNEIFQNAMGALVVPSPYIYETLEVLGRQANLCVASNGMNDLQQKKLATFLPYFEKIFISEEVDRVKPEKEFFARILEEIHCEPQEVLMIGDSLLNDIKGALGAGLDACFYNPKGVKDYEGANPTYVIADYRELPALLK